MELVNLTEYLVRELLPGQEISVKNVESDGDIVIQVLVPSESMSVVIGKAGKIANSIKTIIQAKAYNDGEKKVKINIDSF